MIILGGRDLDDDQIGPLVLNDTLHKIHDRWYYVADPDLPPAYREPDAWNAVYWEFVRDYLHENYGEEWCLSPDCSLDLYSGRTVIPEQLVVRSPHASGEILLLPFCDTILSVQGDIPDEIETEPRYGMHLYRLPLALLLASSDYFLNNPVEARTCLAMIEDTSVISRTAIEQGLPKQALRVAAGLRCLGHSKMASNIGTALGQSGVENLMEPSIFKDVRVTLLPDRSPQGNRVRLMWMKMREEILERKIYLSKGRKKKTMKSVMEMLDDRFTDDAVNALSLDGYDMTEEKLKGILDLRTPDGDLTAEERDEVLAIRGYRSAFDKVRQDILDSMSGGEEPAKKCAHNLYDWKCLLFRPRILADAPGAEEHFAIRQDEHPCITGCGHIPFATEDIPNAMQALSEMIRTEEDSLVRAVLGHYFLMYIQPFADGNEETAKFIMNSQLVCDGYPWVVLYADLKNEYMNALRKAVAEEKIGDLAFLIISMINHSR